jgi:hypothetical protein
MAYLRNLSAYPGPRAKLRGLAGLGQGGSNAMAAAVVAATLPPGMNVSQLSDYQIQQLYALLPRSSGAQPPAPAAQTQTPAQQVQVGAVPSQNPLDYVSPQAAIAAGLDQGVVMQAWTQALAAFPTPTAAVNAGIPAAVVTQLFQASRAQVASAPPWIDGTTLGVPNVVLLTAGVVGAIALLWKGAA